MEDEPQSRAHENRDAASPIHQYLDPVETNIVDGSELIGRGVLTMDLLDHFNKAYGTVCSIVEFVDIPHSSNSTHPAHQSLLTCFRAATARYWLPPFP
jgi:hypothetical protein